MAIQQLKKDISYITRESIRAEIGIFGAKLSDEDCDKVIAEVKRLDAAGEFEHSGVYWIANRLAADGVINPFFE